MSYVRYHACSLIVLTCIAEGRKHTALVWQSPDFDASLSLRTENTTMSTQPWRPQGAPSEGIAGASSGSPGTTRATGKLLATQGYVVGIEISGSAARQSVALADLGGKILRRVHRSLEYVADTQSVLELIDDMLREVTTPERLQDGRILRVGVAVGGLVDATHGIVHTLHHARAWNDFPCQDYLSEKLYIPCIIYPNSNPLPFSHLQYRAAF